MSITQTETAVQYEENLKLGLYYLTEDGNSWIQNIHDDEVNVMTANESDITDMIIQELKSLSCYLEELGHPIWYSQTLAEDLWDTAHTMVQTWKLTNK